MKPTFLPNLPAHGCLQARQVVPGLLLLAIRDGETGVVERVSALRVAVRTANPAFDGGA